MIFVASHPSSLCLLKFYEHACGVSVICLKLRIYLVDLMAILQGDQTEH